MSRHTITGKNIAYLRNKAGLSQNELALDLNVSRSCIGPYEETVSCPKIPLLIKIADYFKVTVDSLIREDLTK